MPKLLASDGEGERLDRFELVAELASGGMATVFLARLSGVAGFQRLVAIKRLHPHLAKEPDFIEMFLDEARLAARIHHPNVVPIQEVGESKAGYYLVMDYVEGDTLARLLARAAQTKTTIPWGVTIRILLDTLAGLHAAHELKDDLGQPLAIVHRDVSPQNILVGSDGIARITDFGVARAASRLSTTRSGQLKGKLAYMAPEQARGDEIDRRADIFSCGIVLWEALALKRLFKGDGEAQTLNRVLYDPIAPPSTQRPDVPKALEDVCMRALDRDVSKRFPTAEAFADELERVARSMSCVGSVRDVAACLEQVFGADMSQQREAVRAWLARSEPNSAPSGPRRPSMPESIKTKVERSKPSPASIPPPPISSTPHGIDRGAVTAPAPPEMLASIPPPSPSHPPEKVSSVSSAVLHVPRFESTSGTAPVPRKTSPARVLGIVAAALVLVGVGVLGATKLTLRSDAGPRSNASASPNTPATTTAPAVATSAAPAPTPTPDVPDTAKPAESAAASPSASVHRPGVATTGKKPGVPARPTANPTQQPTSVPDDLSKNPYR